MIGLLNKAIWLNRAKKNLLKNVLYFLPLTSTYLVLQASQLQEVLHIGKTFDTRLRLLQLKEITVIELRETPHMFRLHLYPSFFADVYKSIPRVFKV